MRRRLLTSTFGVAAVAVVVLCAALALTVGPHHGRLTPAKVGAAVLAALVVAGGLAMAQARRLTRPAQDLARAADRVGSGDARPVGRRYGIIDGLDFAVQRVSDLITAEQDFAVDASHQLRTPLTALSMRLEEMVEAADDPGVDREEGTAALAQTDRLEQVVEWEPAFRAENRKLEVQGDKGLCVYVSAGGVSQVVATLLDNALVHGGGTVSIRTSQTPRSVVIEVKDEGKGVPADLVHRIFERSVSGAGGTGLGLALAKSVASSDGGQLVLVRPRPATFAVIFPQPVLEQLDEPVVAGPA